MLHIVASYPWMHFQGKLMNQTLKKWQETLVLGRFWPLLSKFGFQNFFLVPSISHRY